MTALSYKTAPFCVLRIQLRLCRDKLMKQTKFHWLQLADCKNSPNRGIRRGCPLTSQTAFGGQLPYKGSLVRPVARFHHSLFEYNGRLLRATNHEQRATIFSRAEGHSRWPANCQLRPAGSIGPNIKRKAGLTIDLISLKFLAFSVKFVD